MDTLQIKPCIVAQSKVDNLFVQLVHLLLGDVDIDFDGYTSLDNTVHVFISLLDSAVDAGGQIAVEPYETLELLDYLELLGLTREDLTYTEEVYRGDTYEVLTLTTTRDLRYNGVPLVADWRKLYNLAKGYVYAGLEEKTKYRMMGSLILSYNRMKKLLKKNTN